MTAPTLAEIVAAGERLPREADEDAYHQRAEWWSTHGPRLLAVAKAGAEMRESLRSLDYRKATGKRLFSSLAAWDAAASGEEK